MDPSSLKALVEAELGAARDARVVAAVRRWLVQPRAEMMDWDYGRPGEQFTAWVVLDHSVRSGTEIVYCAEGFGPSRPWGLIVAPGVEGCRFSGMDSGWFPTLMDAWRDSYAALDAGI